MLLEVEVNTLRVNLWPKEFSMRLVSDWCLWSLAGWEFAYQSSHSFNENQNNASSPRPFQGQTGMWHREETISVTEIDWRILFLWNDPKHPCPTLSSISKDTLHWSIGQDSTGSSSGLGIELVVFILNFNLSWNIPFQKKKERNIAFLNSGKLRGNMSFMIYCFMSSLLLNLKTSQLLLLPHLQFWAGVRIILTCL